MAAFDSEWNINGYRWRDATNRTVSGPTYRLDDIIAAGGKIPTIITVFNHKDSGDEPKQRNKNNKGFQGFRHKQTRKGKKTKDWNIT